MYVHRLNVSDLHRRINQKNEKKSLSYEKVMEICNKRIISCAEQNKLWCIYEFPEYVLGFPLFDLNACMEYCKRALMSNGFYVEYYFPNKFYISWDFDEIKRHKEEQRKKTPISAILPAKTTSPTTILPHVQNQSFSATKSLSLDTQQAQNAQTILPTSRPSTPLKALNTPQLVPKVHEPLVYTPNIPPNIPPNVPLNIPLNNTAELHHKITAPLPTSPIKYDPNDIYNITVTNYSNNTYIPTLKNTTSVPIENTFFTKDLKNLLTSDIGNGGKGLFNYKASGKIALDLS